MLWLFNLIRGYVRITVKGFFPERFLNICAKRGILLWDVVRNEKTSMSANVSIKGFKSIRQIAKKSRCTVKIEKRNGVPFLLHKYRKRWALVIGALIFCAIIHFMTMFVWVIDIVGNEAVSDEEILQALEENGLYAGKVKFFIDTEKIKSEMMREVPSLSYIGVNLKGTTAEVNVREREVLPEEYMRDLPTDIVANASGVIEKMNVQGGMQLVKKGDVVVEGEVLVSGIVTASDGEFMRYENSDAEIFARTWREYEIKLPYFKEERLQTGKEKTKHSIKIFNFNINFFIKDGISYQNYDIIESSKNIKLAKNVVLPISHKKKTYSEVEIVRTELTKDEAVAYHKEQIKKEYPDMEIVSVIEEQSGETVKLTYECIENIAKEKNTVQEEKNNGGENT